MRTIHSEFELPDDDEDYVGSLFRKRKHHHGAWLIVLVLLALLAAGVYGALRLHGEQKSDSFCTGCHTAPENTYYQRSESAMAGALAADLASFHYQAIRGRGGDVRCIDCHQGSGDLGSHAEVYFLSARNGLKWLVGRDNQSTEKLNLLVPHLANDTCVACHQKTLLLAGMDNHFHNMLPAAYELWRNGGRLIAPQGARDVQSIIAAGLVKYNTNLTCTNCHQAHRSTEDVQYLDRGTVLPALCVQCHRDTGKGPLEVTVPPPQ